MRSGDRVAHTITPYQSLIIIHWFRVFSFKNVDISENFESNGMSFMDMGASQNLIKSAKTGSWNEKGRRNENNWKKFLLKNKIDPSELFSRSATKKEMFPLFYKLLTPTVCQQSLLSLSESVFSSFFLGSYSKSK